MNKKNESKLEQKIDRLISDFEQVKASVLKIDQAVENLSKLSARVACSDVNKLNAEVVQIQLHSRDHLERIEVLEKRDPPQASISQSAGCTVKTKSCIDQLDNALRRKNIVIANVPEKKGGNLIMDVAAILSWGPPPCI